MSMASGVTINPECIEAFEKLRLGKGAGRTKYIIFKISDNKKEVVVDEVSTNDDYEVFREKLANCKDSMGRPAPRYAAYDVEFQLEAGEGWRQKIVFISWVPAETPVLWSMIYATTRQTLKETLHPHVSIQADDPSEIEWAHVLAEAGGKNATSK
ncbi:Cofilin [Trichophyton interdigitale]|uniref:Cofilin n=5 Tax=Trichophyton TaxID=5550 RepID=A0A9P4YKG5_9EURO|nr:Cofilin [Trichophyton tonsurans CBS 112818]EGE03875.1 cofilin [Trichophyton equinum CBS 127.97]KAF3894644.1 Cofilin [Trichophyton interdigitale]KAF3896632.1 Cofilin [Trichophyton interdigitale]